MTDHDFNDILSAFFSKYGIGLKCTYKFTEFQDKMVLSIDSKQSGKLRMSRAELDFEYLKKSKSDISEASKSHGDVVSTRISTI